MRRALLLAGWLLASPVATAQTLERSCIQTEELNGALSVAIDAAGLLHMARVRQVSGALVHTTLDLAGVQRDEIVAEGVSVLLGAEPESVDLVLENAGPRICFHNAGAAELQLALAGPDGWSIETVAAGAGVGVWCAMGHFDGALIVAFAGLEGGLQLATRQGAGDWRVEVVDDAPGAGQEVDLFVGPGGPVLAHRDAVGLRVSTLRDGRWVSRSPPTHSPAGRRPAVVVAGGDWWVMHGSQVANLDVGEDGSFLLTGGPNGDTFVLDMDAVGGSIAAVPYGGGIAAFARVRQRSVLFGALDAIRLYGDLPNRAESVVLEQSGAAEQRHGYRELAAAADAAGLPTLVFVDEAAAFNESRAFTAVCLYRPPDRDGDALPDQAEGRWGTDPANPDTDGDGRTDGQEVFIDRTNPAGEGPLADAGLPPDPDGAIAPPPADGGPADGPLARDGGSPDPVLPGDGVAGDGSIADARGTGDAAGDGTALDARPEPDDLGAREGTGEAGGGSSREGQAGSDGSGEPGGGGGGGGGCRAAPVPPAPLIGSLLLLIVWRRRLGVR